MSRIKGSKLKREVTIHGRTFESVTEFCDEYGLKYSSVMRYLKKGVEPEKIIEALSSLPATNRYSKSTSFGYKCEYGGVEYPSLVAACEALGIPIFQAYTYKKEHQCSATDALKGIMEQEGPLPAGHATPIMIQGKRYPSKAAACAAFGVPYISIVSRMKRNGTTFEEALLNGGFARRDIKPLEHISAKVLEGLVEQAPGDDDKFWSMFVKTLREENRIAKSFINKAMNQVVLELSESLRLSQEEKTIYIIFEHPFHNTLISVELLIPKLLEIPAGTDDASMLALYKRLNDANAKYAAQSSIVDGWVCVSSVFLSSYPSVQKRLLYANIHRFIGNAAEIQDILTNS